MIALIRLSPRRASARVQWGDTVTRPSIEGRLSALLS